MALLDFTKAKETTKSKVEKHIHEQNETKIETLVKRLKLIEATSYVNKKVKITIITATMSFVFIFAHYIIHEYFI